jgi:hypothetical protein
MRITGALVLALSLSAAVTGASAVSHAKGKAKAGKGEGGAAPAANAAEVNKLKAVRFDDPKAGAFKWGMNADEVMALVKAGIEGKFKPQILKAATDPQFQQRVRDQMTKEVAAVKKSYTKFEGQKSGWDVSIIGQEFSQNTGEAVLVSKEDTWTRYFFFFEGGLYKMFLAFNKDALGGKSFQEFGKVMESKYGRAKEVYRDEKVHGGVRHSLDHFEWSAAGGDRLRLVDRSEFYGVYCMVLFESGTQDRLAERRKVVNPGESSKDALVEAVTAKGTDDGRDANDDIIDRLTGKEVKKPGTEEKHADIVVPSPGGSKPMKDAASKKEMTNASSAAPEKEPAAKKKGKKENPTEGLDL